MTIESDYTFLDRGKGSEAIWGGGEWGVGREQSSLNFNISVEFGLHIFFPINLIVPGLAIGIHNYKQSKFPRTCGNF